MDRMFFLISLLVFFSLMACEKEYSGDIHFIQKTPAIDGQLDAFLADLPKRNFNHIWQFNNPVTDTVPVTYRMAYTPTHLYLYLEAETDTINYRPRGFVNGDGFKFLIGKAQQGELTNEFYDMVFSPSKDKNYWARKRIWDYNHKQGHGKTLSERTLFEEAATDKVCGFEALIAWEDIPPYHPWLMEEIGYNLYFAKAIGDTITNGYAVVEDEGIWDEELPQRAYSSMVFEKPVKTDKEYLLVSAERKHLNEGMPLSLKLVGISNQTSSKNIEVFIHDQERQVVFSDRMNIAVNKNFEHKEIIFPTEKLKPGKYTLSAVASTDTLLKSPLIIFPNINYGKMEAALRENASKVSPGAVHTLMFQLQQLQKKLSDLKSYESGEKTVDFYQVFNEEYEEFKAGVDPYFDRNTPYRRAFLSKQDGTFQPYTIKLPENYDPSKKYPLLVFLHGSGQDEQGILNLPRSSGDFIEIAPLARDIYYCYSSGSSQIDILEAVEDVSTHFSVDEDKIVIGGFSMGGYGALRTYYEHPELYKGVAVFAGHPHLASNWLEGEHPHFLQDKYLNDFSGIPVFIYHGRKDGSLPVQKAEALIQKLKEVGANVTYSLVEEKGHQYPDEQTNAQYFEWLKKAIGQ